MLQSRRVTQLVQHLVCFTLIYLFIRTVGATGKKQRREKTFNPPSGELHFPCLSMMHYQGSNESKLVYIHLFDPI